MRAYITDVLGINFAESIITLNQNTIKLTKKKTQEYYINQEINAYDRPKIRVLTLAALGRFTITVTWLSNR